MLRPATVAGFGYGAHMPSSAPGTSLGSKHRGLRQEGILAGPPPARQRLMPLFSS